MKKKAVVIGSGLAGTLLCNELAKYSYVTLLEQGPKKSIQIPKLISINKKLAEVPTFCIGRGGTSNLWHNGLIPINLDDITSNLFHKVLSNAYPYMDQAASALFFKNGSYSGESKKIAEDMNALAQELAVFPHGIDCIIYPKRFTKLTPDPSVKGVYNIGQVDFIMEGNRVKAVTFTAGGRQDSVPADIVAISAGGLGTPGVLERLITRAGKSNERLGLGFIDHPVGFVGKVKFKKDMARVFKKLSAYDKGGFVVRSAVRLKSPCGRYTGCAYFRPAMTMANSLALYKYKSALGAGSGLSRLKKVFSTRLFHPDIQAEIFSHLFHVPIPGRTFNILFVGEQKRGKNRAFYKDETLHVDWSISPEELATYQGMLQDLQGMLSGLLDDMNIKTDITEDWLWSMAHHSGTVSMGDADEDLVDQDLKLRCCDNVYVCDGSVIQEHSYANTGLTIGQLALRLAHRIREEMTERQSEKVG